MARSERWLQGASRALEDGRWDDVVFSSQMAVEVASKAVLFAMGIDAPKQHDVSALFREVGSEKMIPRWFPTERLASSISTFSGLRALAEYAYERGVGGDHFKGEAPGLLKDAEDHVSACRKLLEELFGGGRAEGP